MSQSNPLAKHFRQPAIFLKLPSQGKYWKEGSIDLPVTGDLPVYPMTTKDEITLRTPDALLNGQGVVDVIQSCCPNIKNAWEMPNNEADPILIALRIASYGSTMSINTNCSHCNAENRYDVDLNQVLDTVRFPNFEQKLTQDGLTFKFKPQTYLTANKANLAAFEEQKLLEILLQQSTEDDKKLAEFNTRLQKLNELNVDLLAESVEYIQTEEGEKVVNTQFIKEFFDNANSATVKEVQKSINEINKQSQIPNMRVVCDSCEKDYEVSLEFNYSSFFGNG